MAPGNEAKDLTQLVPKLQLGNEAKELTQLVPKLQLGNEAEGSSERERY